MITLYEEEGAPVVPEFIETRKERTIYCNICGQVFYTRSAERAHRSRKHRGAPRRQGGNHGIKRCGYCNGVLKNSRDLCQHVSSAHDIPANIISLAFDTKDQFSEWHKQQSEEGHFDWVKSGCKKATGNVRNDYLSYKCHRSGQHISNSTGLRSIKNGGSIKTGFDCTAFVNASIHGATGKVSVTACLDHYGHDLDAGKNRIPDTTPKPKPMRKQRMKERVMSNLQDIMAVIDDSNDQEMIRAVLQASHDLRLEVLKMVNPEPVKVTIESAPKPPKKRRSTKRVATVTAQVEDAEELYEFIDVDSFQKIEVEETGETPDDFFFEDDYAC